MVKITKKLEKIIQSLAGPAAETVNKLIRDELHPLRAERQLKLLEKAAGMIEGADYKVTEIPQNILLPILDYASVGESEQLHTAWAALLANAARQEEGPKTTQLFVEILRQLSAPEARFLLSLHDLVEQEYGTDGGGLEFLAAQSIVLGTDVDLLIKYLKLGLGRPKDTREQALKNIPGDLRDFMVILDNLERLNLLSYRLDVEAPGWEVSPGTHGLDPVRIYHLTMLGLQFIRSCQST